MCYLDYNQQWYPNHITYYEPMTLSTLSKPTANITVNKSRKKVFQTLMTEGVIASDGDKVFLTDGDEFELELFNPTQGTIAAEISIDGTVISGGMLVMRPGERTYVERFFDKAVRFKYSTYVVEAGNSEVEAAIAKNGLVTVRFFEEYVKPVARPLCHTHGGMLKSMSFGGPIAGSASVYSASTAKSASMDNMMSFSDSVGGSTASFTSSVAPATQETGRVEEGQSSSQRFSYVDKTFQPYALHTVTVKIEPQSKMPVTAADIKVYCTACGRKMKEGEKFCPNDGTKFN